MSLVDGRLLRDGEQVPRLFSPLGRPAETGARQAIGVLWRRKHIVALSLLVGMSWSWLGISQLTPRYSAAAFLLIDPDTTAQFDIIGSVFPGAGLDFVGLQTEIEIIRSNEVLQKAVERLGPELALGQLPPRRTSRAVLGPLLDRLPSELAIMPAARPTAARELPAVIGRLRGGLRITSQGRSRVVKVAFEGADPDFVARAVNTVTDVYVTETLKTKLENTRLVTRWLDDQIADLRLDLGAAEHAAQDFRHRAGLVGGRGRLLATEELSEIKTLLVRAQAERLGVEARLRRLEQLLDEPTEVDSMLEVLDSRVVQDLRRQEARIEGEFAELSSEYCATHPRMVRLQAELAELQARIADEINRIIASMRNEAAIARQREEAVRQTLDDQAAKVARLSESGIRLRELEREATAAGTLLEEFLARRKGAGGQLTLQRPDARVITRAAVPLAPSFPRTAEMMVSAFVASLLLGLFLAFWREQLDYGVRTADEIEDRTGMVTIGLIPQLHGGAKVGIPERRVLDAPTPGFNEAIQTIQTNVALCHLQHSPRTVLVTSAKRKEGRSSIVMALARASAADGHRVAVVDCDLRRPRLGTVFGITGGVGLVDYLLGKATLDKIVRRDPTSGINFIAAGGPTPNPAALLQSDAMQELLTGLARDHTLVLIDSPPVLQVPDARVLGQLVDTTVFVVRWGRVSGEAVSAALKQLVEVGADVAGVVLSMVDMREHDRRSPVKALLPQT